MYDVGLSVGNVGQIHDGGAVSTPAFGGADNQVVCLTG